VESAITALAEWRTPVPAVELAALLTKSDGDPLLTRAATRMCGRAALVRALVDRLGTGGADVRFQALQRLEDLDARGIEQQLEALLDDGTPEVCRQVERMLADAGSTTIRARLLSQLSDRDAAVRVHAVNMLWRLNDASAAPDVARLASDKHKAVRMAVCSFVQDVRSADSAAILRAMLNDADPVIRENALGGIRGLAVRGMTPAVIERLQDPDLSVRDAAVRALRAVAPERLDLFFEALADPGGFPQAVDHLALWAPSEEGARVLPWLAKVHDRPGLLNLLRFLRTASACEDLMKLTGDADPDVRSAALRALAVLPGEKVDAALIRLADDDSADVREDVASALGDRGSSRAVDALMRLLEDKADRVRWRAASALGQLSAARALPALVKRMSEDDWSVRDDAMDAVLGLDASVAMRELAALLKHESAGLRHHALYKLACREEEARGMIVAITACLDDPDWEVRRRATETLETIGGDKAVGALRRALRDPCTAVRAATAGGLGRLKAKDALDDVRALHGRADRDERFEVAMALLELGSEEGWADISRALDSTNLYVREGAIERLGRMGSRASVDRLRTIVLEDDDSYHHAMLALAAIDAEGNLDVFVKALVERNDYNTVALRAAPPEKAIRLLRPLAAEPRLRSTALQALMDLGDAAATREAWTDPEAHMKLRAIASLADHPQTEMAEPVRQSLKSPSVYLREAAARALGVMQGDGAAEALQPLLRDSCVTVRLAAAEALCRMGRREGVAVLFEERHRTEAPGPDVLNAVRRPDAFRRLAAVRLRPSVSATLEQVVRDLAERAGLKVKVETRLRPVRYVDGRTLDAVMRRWSRGETSLIIEDDVVRIVDGEQAWKFWRAWWEAANK
jgi:HEAT repeat protein